MKVQQHESTQVNPNVQPNTSFTGLCRLLIRSQGQCSLPREQLRVTEAGVCIQQRWRSFTITDSSLSSVSKSWMEASTAPRYWAFTSSYTSFQSRPVLARRVYNNATELNPIELTQVWLGSIWQPPMETEFLRFRDAVD